MSRIHTLLSRKNVYVCALILIVIGVIFYALFPNNRDLIYSMTFNPFWPVALGILEIYLQNKEKEVAKINEKKINALSGVIRARMEIKEERTIIKSILDSMKDSDLMEYNSSLMESIEFEEKIDEAGMIQGTSQGVNI